VEKLQQRWEKKVKEGMRGEALRGALAVLESRGELKPAMQQEMLELASLKPGAEPFAQTLMLCMAAKLKLDIPSFSKAIGLLMQREAPMAQIRLMLNLILPRGAVPLSLSPPDIDGDEARVVFEDDKACNQSDDEDRGDQRSQPEKLELFTFRAYPELNGVYEIDRDTTSYGRPAYERTQEPRAVAYYKRDSKDPKESGWWLSRSFDGDPLAFNARESRCPPRVGWQAIVSGQRQADSAMFCVPGSEPSRSAPSRDDAEKALRRVDLAGLQGMVEHRDQSTLEYFGHFCVLMHLEYLAEVSAIRKRRLRSSMEQLVRTGWALEGLPVKAVFGRRDGGPGGPRKLLPGWQDNGSEMVAFNLPRNFDSERCRFFKGDCVTVSESDPLKDRIAEGVVTDVRQLVMVVQINGRLPEGRGKTFRLDKSANRVVYERQFLALLQLATTGKLPPCSEVLVAAKVGGLDDWVEEQTGAKRAPKSSSPKREGEKEKEGEQEGQKEAQKESPKSPAPRVAALAAEAPKSFDDSRLEKARQEIEEQSSLNQSQRNAIMAALGRTCTIIQGPPGTGKTHVSVQLLRLLAKVLGSGPLLAASDSNIAVDNIASGLHASGVRVVRLGRPEKVRGYLSEITLEAQLKDAKAKKAEEEAKRFADSSGSEDKARGPKGKGKGGSFKGGGYGGRAGGEADLELEHENRRRDKRVDFELQMKIIKEAEVVCTTTISAGGDFLSKIHFSGILIDEVAQATELSAIVPIVLRGGNNLKRIILVGDHCQLPPGIASPEAEKRGLSLSIYSRLQRAGIDPMLLDTQYRSNPKIMEFSSEAFYKGSLVSGVDAASRPPPRGVPWPNRVVPVAFVEVGSSEETEGDSKFNVIEAERVLNLVGLVLRARELTIADIGIVTPYVAQVRRLRSMMRQVIPPGTDPRALEVASVDAFQGREKELIIFSAVRSNPRGNMGFLADWRRLNVMLTRARRGLVVFGSEATLCCDPFWERWVDWCRRNNAVEGGSQRPPGLVKPLPQRSGDLPGSPSRGSRVLGARRQSVISIASRSASGSRSMSRSSGSRSNSKSRSRSRSCRSRGQPAPVRRRSGWDEGPTAPVAAAMTAPPMAPVAASAATSHLAPPRPPPPAPPPAPAAVQAPAIGSPLLPAGVLAMAKARGQAPASAWGSAVRPNPHPGLAPCLFGAPIGSDAPAVAHFPPRAAILAHQAAKVALARAAALKKAV